MCTFSASPSGDIPASPLLSGSHPLGVLTLNSGQGDGLGGPPVGEAAIARSPPHALCRRSLAGLLQAFFVCHSAADRFQNRLLLAGIPRGASFCSWNASAAVEHEVFLKHILNSH